MRWKHHSHKGQFEKLDTDFRCFLYGLDYIIWGLFHYELMTTSVYREGDKGFHGEWRAIDFRTFDMPSIVLEAVLQFLKLARSKNQGGGRDKKKYPRIEFEYEIKGKKNGRGNIARATHLHVESDNREPTTN